MKKKILIVIIIILAVTGTILGYKKYSRENLKISEITTEICKRSIEFKAIDKKILESAKKEMNTTNEDLYKYFLKGYFSYKDSNYKESEKYLKLSTENFDRSNDTLLKIYNGTLLADSLAKQGKTNEALNTIESTFKLVPENEYDELYEYIWGLLSIVGYIDNKSDIMIDSLNHMIDLPQKPSKEYEAYIYERLAFANSLKKRYSSAVYLTGKTIAIVHDKGDKYKESLLKIDLATMIIELDGYKRGEKIINEALNIKLDDKSKDAEVKLYAYAILMSSYIKQGEYDKVLEYANKIEKYKKYVDEDIYNDMEIYKQIFSSRVYTYREELSRSKKCLDEASNLMKEDSYWYFVGKDIYYYDALAKYDEAIGNYDEAIKNYKKALKSSESNDMEMRRREILENLSYVYDKQGNLKERDKYHKILIEEYKNNNVIRNEENISYIIDKVNTEKEIYDKSQNELRIYKIASICICLVTVLLSILLSQLKKSKKESNLDALTGIHNRRYFDTIYKKYLDRDEEFSVIMMDIDNFKMVNDTYGHEFGDTVIKYITSTVKKILDEDDKEFRYGGEEFVVLLKKKGIEEAINIAEEIRTTIETKVWEEGLVVTLSLGVAEAKDGKNTMEIADKNLYVAKKSGKNKVIGD